jgi:hypothetical protein
MQVRPIAVPAIACQPDDLAAAEAISDPNAETTHLKVPEHGKFPVTVVD